MNQVSNRKKLRREYLTNKGKAYSRAVLLPLLAILLVVLIDVHLPRSFTSVGFIGGAVAFAYSRIVRCSWRYSKRQVARAAQIPYVPPVTTDSLPAEEVLVRGATAPPASGKTLLRAAVKGEETKAEELLRNSRGG